MNNLINCKNSSAKIEITYEFFMDRLLQIYKECRLEVYYAEIFMPLFRMCETDDAKIVPVYNNRQTGRKANSKKPPTPFARLMNAIRAVVDNKSVVPDYIYVSKDYSFDNPSKPYVIIETKAPAIKCSENGNYYYKKLEINEDIRKELLVEVQSCGNVILTDGITWIFCVWKGIINVIETIELFATKKELPHKNIFIINQEDISDEIEQKEWLKLKERINKFLLAARHSKEKNN